MFTIELQQWWKSLSSFIEHMNTDPIEERNERFAKYSVEGLWGATAYEGISALEKYADVLYRNHFYSKIFEAAQTYLKAANYALALSAAVDGTEPKEFLLHKKIIPLYGQAFTGFFKFITYENFKDAPELNLMAFRVCIDTLMRVASLNVLAGEQSWPLVYFSCIKDINKEMKQKYGAEKTSEVIFEIAKSGEELGLPSKVLIQLYNVCIENLSSHFYDEKPSDAVENIYRISMEEAIAHSANLDEKTFQSKNEQMQKMIYRLDFLRPKIEPPIINIDTKKNANNTLRHRKPFKLKL